MFNDCKSTAATIKPVNGPRMEKRHPLVCVTCPLDVLVEKDWVIWWKIAFGSIEPS